MTARPNSSLGRLADGAAIDQQQPDRAQRAGTGPMGAADPNLSPDGETLSYIAFNGQPTGEALFVGDATGANPFAVTGFETDVAIKHDWSPVGHRILFTESGDEPIPGVSANIDTIRPDWRGLRHLTHYTGQIQPLSSFQASLHRLGSPQNAWPNLTGPNRLARSRQGTRTTKGRQWLQALLHSWTEWNTVWAPTRCRDEPAETE
jgi:hypothetical protein